MNQKLKTMRFVAITLILAFTLGKYWSSRNQLKLILFLVGLSSTESIVVGMDTDPSTYVIGKNRKMNNVKWISIFHYEQLNRIIADFPRSLIRCFFYTSITSNVFKLKTTAIRVSFSEILFSFSDFLNCSSSILNGLPPSATGNVFGIITIPSSRRLELILVLQLKLWTICSSSHCLIA